MDKRNFNQSFSAGLFGRKELLLDDRNSLVEWARKANENTFTKDGPDSDLAKYNDLRDYLDKNDIELDDEEMNLFHPIDKWINLNLNYETKKELYRGIVEKSLFGFGPSYVSAEAELMAYFPEDFEKKLPTRGGWIFIKQDIPVERHLAPITYGIYYAKGIYRDCPRAMTIRNDYKITIPNAGKMYRVKINTGKSDVVIFPHEYTIIPDVKEVLKELGNFYEMVKLGGTPNLETERIHYLSTRGLKQEDIWMRLLQTVNTSNFCLFAPTENAVKYFSIDSRERIYDMLPDALTQFTPETLTYIKF